MSNVEFSKRDVRRIQRKLDEAPRGVLTILAKKWRATGMDFVREKIQNKHLSGKPIKKGVRLIRNPGTPYNVLTKISGALFASQHWKMERPRGDILLRMGTIKTPKNKPLRAVMAYAGVHAGRIEFEKEFKSAKGEFIRDAEDAIKEAFLRHG